MNQTLLFFLLTLLSVMIQGMFALFEMGCVSFNKVRLQYYVSIKNKRAIWLQFLLQRPSRLFGTTLIGINTALQVGSECSRQFYESLHLDPDWAPLTQVLIVVVFAELAPLFAARRHPEQVAMFLAPFMTFIARLLTPFTWAFGAISNLIHHAMGKSSQASSSLSREEIKLAFEDTQDAQNELTAIVGQIFQLKAQTAKELMTPLSLIQTISSSSTLADVRHYLSVHYTPFIPIYYRTFSNIVAIAHVSDLLRCDEKQSVIKCSRSPWFVTETTSVLDILEQFKSNNQRIAIILNSSGQPIGLLTLEQILSQIFGKVETKSSEELSSFHIERTLPGEMTVTEFNMQFQAAINHEPEETLSDLIARELGHLPAKGEAIRLDPFVFTVLEPSLRGAKLLAVYTPST